MKNSRPYTANKENRGSRLENKTILSQIKRPLSAKNDSLKRIIQVIQNTLNKGAQSILKKTKTLQKFKKLKSSTGDTQFRLPKECSKYQRQPQFRTQKFISNSPDMYKSASSIKSSKKIFPSFENEDFLPYMMQQGQLKSVGDDEYNRKDKAPMKKINKRIKQEKQKDRKSNKIQYKQIDKWQNQPSFLNMSYLLDRNMA